MTAATWTWLEISTWISLFLSASAGWANLYGVWVWRGKTFVQLFYGAVAFVAWFYASGYIWLIVTGDRLAWSEFYSGFGPIVWLLVWNIPPIAAARARRDDIKRLHKTSKSVALSLNDRRSEGLEL